ncbi:hypothetical protein MCUN1_000190 [Malassezia cuniculi]|uniref:Cullin-3 n=1 Tax=Malassezia cuniculi TaxID=948313 RepID=A0AAF0EQV7_9BASI|nr:hypothetical protein MCUN1_000190 [Malassezia cuniculi]
MSLGHPRRLGARGQKLRAPRSGGLTVSIDDMWARLSDAITQIQHHNISRLSYEEHYRYAYNLVLNQQGDMLYAGVSRQVQEHLVRQCESRLVPGFPLDGAAVDAARDVFAGTGGYAGRGAGIAPTLGLLPRSESGQAVLTDIPARERFLAAISAVWEDHCSCMGKIRDVLKYVDRVYVVNHGKATIWDLGLELFRDTVILSPNVPVQQNLYATLLSQLYCEREGSTVERSKIKAACGMLQALDYPRMRQESPPQSVYTHDFEPLLLATAAEYYATEATILLAQGDAAHYLVQVEKRLADEEARIASCVAQDSVAQVRAVLEKELIHAHLDEVLAMANGGLVALLESDRRDDLARLHRLFSLVEGGLAALHKALRVYATEHGRQINEQGAPGTGAGADVALNWVNGVLSFKARFDGVLYTAFASDMGAEAAVNEAFDSFINMNNRAPEYISLFIDEHLKKGTRNLSDEETDSVLDRATVLFRFIHEKDVFERYYKLHLTRRLLQGRSVSDDAERGMVAKLKVESGHGYVQKMQGMLNDMKLSTDVLGAFRNAQQRGTADATPFELNVNVLTATYWPISAPQQPAIFPPVLREACAAFERYYDTRHRGRVLSWQPSLGSAEVRVRFRARTHELIVSTYALIVLLLFEGLEHGASLGYTDILTSTALPPADLQRTLQSLACAKYRVLRKEPRSRDIGAGDRFYFNDEFTCPLARVKISQIAAKVETSAEHRETAAKVEEERKNLVEACIVRVMKSRKTLPHNDLVHEVVQQLLPRFQPSPALIKKRIESLLDREYLEAPGAQAEAPAAPQSPPQRRGSSVAPTTPVSDSDEVFARARALGLRLSRADYERTRAGITALLKANAADSPDDASRAKRPGVNFFSATVPEARPHSTSLDAVGSAEERRRRRTRRRRAMEKQILESQASPTGSVASAPAESPTGSHSPSSPLRCSTPPPRGVVVSPIAGLNKHARVSPAGKLWIAQSDEVGVDANVADDSGVYFDEDPELSQLLGWGPRRNGPGSDALDTCMDRICLLDRIMARHTSPRRMRREAKAREREYAAGCTADSFLLESPLKTTPRRDNRAQESATTATLAPPSQSRPHTHSHARQRSLHMRAQLTPRADTTPIGSTVTPLRHTETPMVTPLRFPGAGHRRNPSFTSLISPGALTPWTYSARHHGHYVAPPTLGSSPYTGDAAIALSMGGGPARYGLVYMPAPNTPLMDSDLAEHWMPEAHAGGSPARLLCVDSFPGKSPVTGDISPPSKRQSAASPLAAKSTGSATPVQVPAPSSFLSLDSGISWGSPSRPSHMGHRRVPSRRLDTISPADILYTVTPQSAPAEEPRSEGETTPTTVSTPPLRQTRRRSAVVRAASTNSVPPTHKVDVFAPEGTLGTPGSTIDTTQLDDPKRTVWQQPDGSCIVKLVSEELQAAIDSGSLEQEPEPRFYRLPPGYGSSKAKPASVSYAGLIGQAILSSSDGRLSLAEIYAWISTVYPFYERGDRGWQNSIRHNLSLNKSFVKLERESSIPGKGGWWAIAQGHEGRFCNGVYVSNPTREQSAAGNTGERAFRVTHSAPSVVSDDRSARKRRTQAVETPENDNSFKRPRSRAQGDAITPANARDRVTPMRSAGLPSSVYNSRHMPLLTDASSPPTSPLADFMPCGNVHASAPHEERPTQHPRTLGQIVDYNMQLMANGNANKSSPIISQPMRTSPDKSSIPIPSQSLAVTSPARMYPYASVPAHHSIMQQGYMHPMLLGGTPDMNVSSGAVPWLDESLAPGGNSVKEQQGRNASNAYSSTFGARHIARGVGRLTQHVFREGRGAYITTEQGARLLDMTSGIGVVNLGHCHPAVTRAAQEQCARITHAQVNIGYSAAQLELIRELLTIVPHPSLDTFFFWNSGAEAVEASIKIARAHTGKPNVIVMQGSYHGRTAATAAMTRSKTVYGERHGPLMPGVFATAFPYYAQFGLPRDTPISELVRQSLHQLRLVLKQQTAPSDTAAVIVETVIGEGGYVPAPKEFLDGVRQICDEHGLLYIADEVQAGFGRTGKMFAVEHSQSRPDILVAAKGLANGYPLSCVISRKDIMDSCKPGSLGGTYAGNAVSCAAAAAVVRAFREENVLENCNLRSKQLVDGLTHIRDTRAGGKLIEDIRGLGLMIGVQFATRGETQIAGPLTNACAERGMLILSTSAFDVVRWIPPLNVTEEEISDALAIFADALDETARAQGLVST